MLKILIIVGSTRPNRKSEEVAQWFVETASQHKDFVFELVDLAELSLPFFDEPLPPIAGNYQNSHTKEWAKQIDAADGYILVTPEYNHSYPAVLKNALDFAYAEWRHKPVGFVSYGVANGVRAVEHLKPVTVQLDMVPINASVNFNLFTQWSKDGGFAPAEANKTQMEEMLAELKWWGEASQTARGQAK